jgi:nicotinamidase-related amidase
MGKKALIIVDVQNDFCETQRGSLADRTTPQAQGE